ncbi:nucleotide-binding universal stress UspA family protein [Streptosporangium becharense]|uniref:Nucleotide-binding universal stress UspA family protein n=1 Tax=Streptosporangium becharense TaxID=1816182 RepID=A0A7W9MEN4_9ACTN|nr:universal stress protein [Streptosporangium becharense]MBB2910819.1 nucleotide-binding universal stress UspA family protein [Streptosporangium becharense]MBB5817514.1 nucleotide-binding universal stress UspA family protein [Streptosporangium becharense]
MSSTNTGRTVPDPSEGSPPIVVAVDGSDDATRAVRWAADDAFRRRLPLRIVHVVERGPYDTPRFAVPDLPRMMVERGREVLLEAERTVRARQPSVEVSTELIEGSLTGILRREADAAAETVLGSRGLGGFAGALLGSVSTHVAGHAHGPVVVVRPGGEEARREVVVGVDDSTESEPALAYAFEQARLRGCVLRAVHAWQLPVHAFAPEVVYDMDEIRRAQHEVVRERLQAWREKYPGVTVVDDVRSGHPVDALTDASGRADLVVVGSRGRGLIGAALLGSVSRGVLHHARCPVAVVRS